MKELKVLNHNGTLVVDSREVANMIGKQHAHLLRDIQGYIQILEKNAETLAMPNESKFGFVKNPSESNSGLAEKPNERKIAPVDENLATQQTPNLGAAQTLAGQQNPNLDSANFFIPSTYVDPKGEIRPCYLLTRKGCDMVANKMTGEKGVLFTAAYVDKFYEMESALRQCTVSQAPLPDKAKEMRAEAMLYNAKTKQAELWMKLGDMLDTPEHKQLCAAYCSQVLTGGQMVLPLPQVERTYSAQEVADMYGITANRVGRIANENGLKTAKYGHLVMDVARHCQGKAVQSFRYNETGARAIGEYARKQ